MPQQRLSKVLAALGVASRRQCEQIITSGRICVNGQTITKPQHHVDPHLDIITIDNKRLGTPEEKKYYILNKPRGYLCSNRRFRNDKLVIDLFSEVSERLFTVGRLDKDTEGLLLVTNDGHFANRVIHPSSDIEKEYLVESSNPIQNHHLKKLKEGCYVEGIYVKPVGVQIKNKYSVAITVTEGKKREVRILAEHASISLIHLTRTRIGQLYLPALKPGQWKKLSNSDRERIFRNC